MRSDIAKKRAVWRKQSSEQFTEYRQKPFRSHPPIDRFLFTKISRTAKRHATDCILENIPLKLI